MFEYNCKLKTWDFRFVGLVRAKLLENTSPKDTLLKAWMLHPIFHLIIEPWIICIASDKMPKKWDGNRESMFNKYWRTPPDTRNQVLKHRGLD